ncbi:MAG TPA: DoxX family protein [Alphaproteobacteria bacterium]|nr:DoxX family protein [Alphaproteobacteria bacterium]
MSTQSITAQPVIPALGGVYAALAPLAEALPRVAAGLLLVPHGAQKLFGWFGGHGLAGTAQFLGGMGFEPGLAFALLVGGLEFFGGLMLAFGLLTRPIAAAVAVFMAVALTVHAPVYFWNNGGIEMPLLWGLVALAYAIRGGGRYSLDALIGREV